MPNTDLILKNTGAYSQVWGGQTVDATSEYNIQDSDRQRLINDTTFREGIVSGIAVINDGTNDLDPLKAVSALTLDYWSYNRTTEPRKGLNYRYSHDGGVPSCGTRYMRLAQGNLSSVCGDRIISDSTISHISVEVDSSDVSRAYDVQVLSDPSGTPDVLATLTLLTDVRGDSTQISVPVSSNSEIGCRVVRTSGSGMSTFNNIVVSVSLTEE